ncbi:MAG: ABC transporter ATP-binding protein [Lachnospiraceae bacterium]|nr:ABC transporter ATP-binding protein [Lachnospiraceae bacterium]MBR5897326.1 ABC transporter ATP-binding protein [Lachnospiraceae bacterium]
MELTIKNVTKTYADKTAVNNVSLTITPGVFGLLGANGAGKTTLMRIIADIIKPSSGEVLYNGIPIETLDSEYRNIFGHLPQEFGFYPEFRVTDYLEYIAAIKGLTKKDTKQRIEELLVQMSLEEVRNKKIKKLSGGTRRRVGIAQALLNNPEVLILDEPTAGLDPGERIKFRSLLSEFSKKRIVLISTHIVSDIEYIASRNAIMKEGEIIQTGTTDELIGSIDGKVWECVVDNYDLPWLEKKVQIVNLRNEASGSTTVRYLGNCPVAEGSVSVSPRLEDLYMWLFGSREG